MEEEAVGCNVIFAASEVLGISSASLYSEGDQAQQARQSSASRLQGQASKASHFMLILIFDSWLYI